MIRQLQRGADCVAELPEVLGARLTLKHQYESPHRIGAELAIVE